MKQITLNTPQELTLLRELASIQKERLGEITWSGKSDGNNHTNLGFPITISKPSLILPIFLENEIFSFLFHYLHFLLFVQPFSVLIFPHQRKST